MSIHGTKRQRDRGQRRLPFVWRTKRDRKPRPNRAAELRARVSQKMKDATIEIDQLTSEEMDCLFDIMNAPKRYIKLPIGWGASMPKMIGPQQKTEKYKLAIDEDEMRDFISIQRPDKPNRPMITREGRVLYGGHDATAAAIPKEKRDVIMRHPVVSTKHGVSTPVGSVREMMMYRDHDGELKVDIDLSHDGRDHLDLNGLLSLRLNEELPEVKWTS